jgi:DNA-binding protein HU-beta
VAGHDHKRQGAPHDQARARQEGRRGRGHHGRPGPSVVDAAFDAIAGELAAGRDVAIAGFGKFSVSERAAREGRNPATGETIQIAGSRAAKFSAAAALKQQLNS